MKGELEIHRHRFRPKEPTDDEFWVIFAIGSSIKSPKKMLLKGKISWVTSSHLAQATLVDIKKKAGVVIFFKVDKIWENIRGGCYYLSFKRSHT